MTPYLELTEPVCGSCRFWCRPIEGELRRGLCLARSGMAVAHWDTTRVVEIIRPVFTFASDSCGRFDSGPPPNVEIQGAAGDLLWILLEPAA